MKALETFYNGIKYRSRLEARWAVYFDHLGIKYEYEPEGFTDSMGSNYLPDFYLPDVYYRKTVKKGIYIEIKPSSYVDEQVKSSSWFNEPLFLFKGPPAGTCVYDSEVNNMFECWSGGWDNHMGLFICDNCGLIKIAYSFGNGWGCQNCNSSTCIDKFDEAESLALSERFES